MLQEVRFEPTTHPVIFALCPLSKLAGRKDAIVDFGSVGALCTFGFDHHDVVSVGVSCDDTLRNLVGFTERNTSSKSSSDLIGTYNVDMLWRFPRRSEYLSNFRIPFNS